jgi:hypothetical protein
MGSLVFLVGLTGCTSCYWETDYTNNHGDFRPELNTPFGDFKTSR